MILHLHECQAGAAGPGTRFAFVTPRSPRLSGSRSIAWARRLLLRLRGLLDRYTGPPVGLNLSLPAELANVFGVRTSQRLRDLRHRRTLRLMVRPDLTDHPARLLTWLGRASPRRCTWLHPSEGTGGLSGLAGRWERRGEM